MQVSGILLDLDPAQLLSIARSPDIELPRTVTKVLEQLDTRADLDALGVTLVPPFLDPGSSGLDSLDLGFSSAYSTPLSAQHLQSPYSGQMYTEPATQQAESSTATKSLQQPSPSESGSTTSSVAPALGYQLSTILQRQKDLAGQALMSASVLGGASPGPYQPLRVSHATAAESLRVPGVYPGSAGDDSMLVIPLQVPGGRLAEWCVWIRVRILGLETDVWGKYGWIEVGWVKIQFGKGWC